MRPYKDQFQSQNKWNAFRERSPQLNLPHSNTLKRYFESWNNVKLAMGIKVVSRRKGLTQKEYIQLLLPYKEEIRTIKEWDQYRKQHPKLSLPAAQTLINAFDSWNNMKFALGLERRIWIKGLTQSEYIQLLQSYKIYLKSINIWNEYRKEHPELKLPSTSTLINRFGTWNKLKQKIGLKKEGIKNEFNMY